MDSGGLKEARVQSYLLGGANAPTWEGTLAPPGEYDSTVCVGDAVLCQITLTTLTINFAKILTHQDDIRIPHQKLLLYYCNLS